MVEELRDSDFIQIKELREEDEESTPVFPVEKKGKKENKGIILVAVFLALGLGILLGVGYDMTISSECISNDTLINQTQLAFLYGMDLTLAKITNESLQCNQIPMNYSGYEYTLYPLECLELNQGGNK